MLSNYLSPIVLSYAGFRLVLFALTLLGLGLAWRRPRPRRLLLLLVGAHLATGLASLAPLQRSYGLDEATDRSFNLGMAAGAALGGSIFEHTQVGFGSPEPIWNLIVATLAGFDVERVALAFAALTPLALLLVAICLYRGLADDDSDEDAWERVWLVFAVLGLSSLSMNPRPPTPAFWAGNFLLKPNHGVALGLVGVVLGLVSRRTHAAIVGLALGALAWVFLIDWAYLLVGLGFGLVVIPPAPERRWRDLAVMTCVSALVAAPYVLHLLPDYSPAKSHAAAQHMWGDPRGLPLAVPNWSSLDLGPLLVLGLLGAGALHMRKRPRDVALLGTWLGAIVMVAASIPAALLGLAPEPDELHYFLRFSFALMAGSALAAGGRQVERAFSLLPGRGHLIVLGCLLPLSLPSYWDPPSMDRYFRTSRLPIQPKVEAYARVIRERTPPAAVFAAGRIAATWIPALTGRKVLLAENGKLLPPDLEQRKAVERTLLLSQDPDEIRAAAARYGVRYVAIDEALVAEYGATDFHDLARAPVYRPLVTNSAARILELPPP